MFILQECRFSINVLEIWFILYELYLEPINLECGSAQPSLFQIFNRINQIVVVYIKGRVREKQ